MATYYPDWLPVLSGMPDIEASYQAGIPLQWPRGLRFEDTDIDYHRQAYGVVFSWVAEAIWAVQRNYFPQSDTEGVFLPWWEEALGISSAGTITQRQLRVTAALRSRGTGNEDIILGIMSTAYGFGKDASDIVFVTPDLSTVIADNPPADDPGWLDAFTGHFYTTSTPSLDHDMALDLLARITPAGWRWTAGDTQYLKCTTIPLDQGVLS